MSLTDKSPEETKPPVGRTDQGDSDSPNPHLPAPLFTRYKSPEFIGEGGMARVFSAYDPSLQRKVALKLIRGDDPTMAHRLLLEARAQGRINHPNICKVYEVGDIEGRVCIAMQFIDGQTLGETRAMLTLEQKVKIMKEVAGAVHAAHREGLIHRDLKPANIMVERTEDGTWVPYVMDFGLAREVEAAGVTATGAIVGSPFYMSPEQAAGEIEELDRRSDVYSLGVTLYELLSGSLPYNATSSFEALVSAVQKDPVPVRQRSSAIPRDLETIVMKCLEKKREARYESVKALAQDLDLFLEGLPITARPAGFLLRAYKKALRHKAITAVSVVAILLVVLFAGIGLYQYRMAQERAALAQEFGLQVKEIENIWRVARMLPLHNVQGELSVIESRMENIRQKMNQSGKISEGPGHYALGRGYLALQDLEKAKSSLQKAHDSGYSAREVSYALGFAMGELYQRALEEARRIGNRQLREERISHAQAELRDPALRYLKMSRGLETENPIFVEGLISFYEKNYGRALEMARESFAGSVWLFEAKKLEGDIHRQWGSERKLQGDLTGAMKKYDEAGEAYGVALSIARSEPSIYQADCDRWKNILTLEGERGRPVHEPYRNGVSACEKALVAYPRMVDAINMRSHLERAMGEFLMDFGEDPLPHFTRAVSYAQKAGELEPDNAASFWNMGASLVLQGQYEIGSGISPESTLKTSVSALRQAADLDPRNPIILHTMGIGYSILGEHEMGVGKDPRPNLDSAIQRFQTAISINPGYARAYDNLATTYDIKGQYEFGRGLDPWDSLEKAIESYQKGIEIDPHPYSYNNLCTTLLYKGVFQMASGMDPTAALKLSQEKCRTAESLHDAFAYAIQNHAEADVILASYALSQGQDPTESLESAMEGFQKALQINPDYASAYASRALAQKTKAYAEFVGGKSPEDSLRAARESIHKAKENNPSNHVYFHIESQVDLLAARYAMKKGESPDGDLAHAAKSIQEGLRLKPDDVSLLHQKAEALAWQSLWHAGTRNNRQLTAALEEGFTAIDQAESIVPNRGELKATRGLLLLCRSRAATDPRVCMDHAVLAGDALREAIRLNKNIAYLYTGFLKEADQLHQSDCAAR